MDEESTPTVVPVPRERVASLSERLKSVSLFQNPGNVPAPVSQEMATPPASVASSRLPPVSKDLRTEAKVICEVDLDYFECITVCICCDSL